MKFEVGYEYEIQGREWSAYQYRLGSKNLFDSVTIADAKAREYYPGREAWCYVNPAQPGQAILEHNSLALGLTIFLPVVFMVIGAAALVSLLDPIFQIPTDTALQNRLQRCLEKPSWPGGLFYDFFRGRRSGGVFFLYSGFCQLPDFR